MFNKILEQDKGTVITDIKKIFKAQAHVNYKDPAECYNFCHRGYELVTILSDMEIEKFAAMAYDITNFIMVFVKLDLPIWTFLNHIASQIDCSCWGICILSHDREVSTREPGDFTLKTALENYFNIIEKNQESEVVYGYCIYNLFLDLLYLHEIIEMPDEMGEAS